MKPVDPIARTPMDLEQARVLQGTVHVIDERCKECSFCIQYCPTGVLEYSKATNSKGYHFPVVVEGKESACVLATKSTWRTRSVTQGATDAWERC